jgi:hypothetical protein
MFLYHAANKRLTTENVLLICATYVKLAAVILLTLLLSNSYAIISPGDSLAADLTPQDKSYINSLTNNIDQIPAWLIAQLLHVSNSLADKIKEKNTALPVIELNDLLADPDHYRGQVVAIKTLYAKSSDVKELLQLAPDEQAWSVLLIDAQYHHALQLFTNQNPSKFQKSQLVYAIGVFLTTRLDRPEKDNGAQSIVVPVIIGTIMPVDVELPPVKNKKIFNFLAPVILLTVIYMLVKIYTKCSTNVKLSLRERLKGKTGNFSNKE